MSRTAVPIAWVLAFAMPLPCPIAAAAQERVGDVEFSLHRMVRYDRPIGGTTRQGYIEHRVRLRNRAASERIVHLRLPSWRHVPMVVTRTVRLAGGQEVAVSLYQLPAPLWGETVEVRVEGVARSKEVRGAASPHGRDGYVRGHAATVLFAESVPLEFPREVQLAPDFDRYASPSEFAPPWDALDGRLVLLRSAVPVGQWSPNWLGYSCYDAIVCSEQEAEEMPPPVRRAVRRFIECGGTLLIRGPNVPAAFSEHGFADGEGGYFVGMGRVATALDARADDWDATSEKLAAELAHIHETEEVPTRLDGLLVAEPATPISALIVLVLVFVLAVGPANLWLLSRYERDIWLWWNVPAISLLSGLLMFVYFLTSVGWSPRGKAASFTLLDERRHRATTIGYLSYYCPLGAGGLRFGSDTEVTPLETEPADWRRYETAWGPSNGRYFVDWTHAQHLTSGWIRARVPAYFQVRKNEDRRERLAAVVQPDGSVKVANGLGADIERLYLADASGRVWEGRRIPAGAGQTLSAAAGAGRAEDNPARMRDIFTSSNWLGLFRDIDRADDPAGLLSPGWYLALLDRSPFIESPLERVEPEHTIAIVYGIMPSGERHMEMGPQDGPAGPSSQER